MNRDPLNLSRFAGPLHALLRIMTALSFISHGTMKLLGFPAASAALGPMPVPLFSFMGAAGLLELVGGLLVMVGFFTRPVAFLLAGEMAVGYFIVHMPLGIIPATNNGEAAYLYTFIFLWLAAAGAGPLSLDNAGKTAA
ncbi:MAG: DoxX family protein [Sphingomonadales bacterium]|nr:DoxX family protein [Sphingomonadales bacterium]